MQTEKRVRVMPGQPGGAGEGESYRTTPCHRSTAPAAPLLPAGTRVQRRKRTVDIQLAWREHRVGLHRSRLGNICCPLAARLQGALRNPQSIAVSPGKTAVILQRPSSPQEPPHAGVPPNSKPERQARFV